MLFNEPFCFRNYKEGSIKHWVNQEIITMALIKKDILNLWLLVPDFIDWRTRYIWKIHLKIYIEINLLILNFRWAKLTKSWILWPNCSNSSSRCKNFNWIRLNQIIWHWWLMLTTLPLQTLNPLKKTKKILKIIHSYWNITP